MTDLHDLRERLRADRTAQQGRSSMSDARPIARKIRETLNGEGPVFSNDLHALLDDRARLAAEVERLEFDLHNAKADAARWENEVRCALDVLDRQEAEVERLRAEIEAHRDRWADRAAYFEGMAQRTADQTAKMLHSAHADGLRECISDLSTLAPAAPERDERAALQPPEWIRVAQDGHGPQGGFWTCAAATVDSPKYIRADLVEVATRDAVTKAVDAMESVARDWESSAQWLRTSIRNGPPTEEDRGKAAIYEECARTIRVRAAEIEADEREGKA